MEIIKKNVCLTDLDDSDWYPFNHDYVCLARIDDWRQFNVLFNSEIPLPDNVERLFNIYTYYFPEIIKKRRILFPNGNSLGSGAFFDSPSWLWPFIASLLPKTRNSFIHLGVQTGGMAIQSLRSGSKKCIILENRPSHKDCAELLLDAYQILDNRTYDIDFVNHSPVNTAGWAWEKGDIVCCFGGLDDFVEQEIITALFNIPTIVYCIILEGKAANYAHFLKERNFKVEQAWKFPFSNRTFVFAYSSEK